jgi:radical SAM protein with 4Fe4S-binding SPASM domain
VLQENEVRDQLQTIYLFLTRKCNLACQHCYIEGVGPARDKDFDLPAIRALIERALPHGLRKVKVSGGEPFVRRDVIEILRYLDALDLEIVLETNGTLFQPDTISQLRALRRLTVYISLDHLEEVKHDEFRGRAGAYGKAVAVLRELGQTEVTSVVTTTASRHNYAQVVDIADMVLDWGIKRHRTLLNIHPLGNARGHLDNAITMEEAEILIARLLRSPHFRSGRAYMTLPPALMPLEMMRDLHTCGWGNSVIGVLSTGEVSMCSASYDDPGMIAGNAFERDLIDIWRESEFFRGLRAVGEGRVKGVCGNCVFYAACRGVCKMSSYAHYGEKDAPYPLCQEVYNRGAFPRYALVDPSRDCRYHRQVIKPSRTVEELEEPPGETPHTHVETSPLIPLAALEASAVAIRRRIGVLG